MKIAFVIDNLGPYHVARLIATSSLIDVFALEVRGSSVEYAWLPAKSVPFERVTLLPADDACDANPRFLLRAALDAAAPDVVFTSGWSSPADLTALLWAGHHHKPAIVMTDSQEIDSPRRAPVEWIKKRILAHVSGAFVGGNRHADYACKLGISKSMIRTGYDVVDNAHFASQPDGARRGFLASARFIPKKNLPFLLRAHAAYRALHLATAPDEPPWDLTLLGDGPTRPDLELLSRDLGGGVIFRGFLQYPDLPSEFARAGAFVHASTTEQWGLVVNEAMASGLPVLVASRCGCVPELIEEGVNGYALDPEDEESWASHMLTIARMKPTVRAAMGKASMRIIARFTPETHAAAAIELAQAALSRPTTHRLRTSNALLISAVAWGQKN